MHTDFRTNPFYILDATTRDNRTKILQLAEDKSLEIDHEACQKARSELTTPKARLKAELCWLPGLSPKRVSDTILQLKLNPYSIEKISSLPALAHANLLSFAIKQIDTEHSDIFISMIEQIIDISEEFNIDEIVRDINEERTIAGFPEISSDLEFEEHLAEIKRSYVKTIITKINELPSSKLVEVMTSLVDEATQGGEIQASSIIDDLVDDYTLHTQQYLADEADNILKLIDAIRDRASNGEGYISKIIDQLITITASWDAVAQPIQLSQKVRGIEHDISNKVGFALRSLSVDLFNDYDYSEQTKKLNQLLLDYFSELRELSDKVEEDADALADIFQNREQKKNKQKEWSDFIRYRAEIGTFFKDVIAIDENQISWKDERYPIDSVTRIAWGATRNSVNGVPTGTTYTIRFGNNKNTSYIETRKEDIYSNVIDRLWRTAGVAILTDMCNVMKSGKGFNFSTATVWDDGVTLTKTKWLGSDEKIKFGWDKMTVWSSNGNFVIGTTDRKLSVELSYMELYNVHVLEQIIRVFFKDSSARRLSDILA